MRTEIKLRADYSAGDLQRVIEERFGVHYHQRHVAPYAQAILIMGCAGWQTTEKLKVPKGSDQVLLS